MRRDPGASFAIAPSTGATRRDRYRRLAGRSSRPRAWTINRTRQAEEQPLRELTAIRQWPSTSRLQIRCFGRFEVWCAGAPVQRWRRRSAITLLKILIAQRRPVHRDELLDLLWPELSPSSSMNGLRVTLHSLRRALATTGHAFDDPVQSDGSVYFFNPAAAVWVDADAFSAHFEAGLRTERQSGLPKASREYAAAEALYRDDFLVEDLYEDWTVVRREQLRDEYLLLLTKMAQHSLVTGDPEGCIVRCHKLLSKEPCNEDAYQRLMRAYAHMDQYGRAAHWYEVCERTLRKELDVEPSPETRRVFRDVGHHRAGDNGP